jgi:UDP-N-acetylglucosamine:LPS N-acetylglucosamine transferase
MPKFIDFAKLRSSWAEVGSATVNAGSINQIYSISNLNAYGLPTLSNPNILPNPNIRPITATTIEGGFDVRMLDNRLGIDVNYYSRRTKNDILATPISNATGYTAGPQNMGLITNKGWEITLSGNPVRKDLIESAGKREQAAAHFHLDPAKKTLLIIGGSQGARTINQGILAGLDRLQEAGVQVIWQTGIVFESTARKAAEGFSSAYVSAFIYEMDLAYAMADLVISRAGASSVSEICLLGKASILVPLPSAAEDHQTENAKSLVSQNAAILVRDAEVKEQLISEALKAIKSDVSTLEKNSLRLAKPNAAHEIAQSILHA